MPKGKQAAGIRSGDDGKADAGHGPWPVYEQDAATPAQDHFIRREGIQFAGSHFIIDLWGATELDNLPLMESTLRRAVDRCGATLLHIHLHHFSPNGGISGVAVLAESHISVHTWPEHGYAAFDVFMCGNTNPVKSLPVFEQAFRPARSDIQELMRGRIQNG
jgi:S-adenosylmethionine decarboxylase